MDELITLRLPVGQTEAIREAATYEGLRAPQWVRRLIQLALNARKQQMAREVSQSQGQAA